MAETVGYFFVGILIFLALERIVQFCKMFHVKWVLKGLPKMQYEEEDDEEEEEKQWGDVSSCVICLEKFKDGDLCRLLPACRHCFHMLCIDVWLLKNLTCPLCRTNVTEKSKFSDDIV
ncbi:hypothetical protein IEQ34_018310 [Dendrobium chrysotoxum]|uniref:RING-type E3 ubiquitin transferase n=1 Tax=Dendrobium chrysotoxum TaxID=161865 RepID=A0AAV7GC08_DENCH|nr:hypothetical protein IEQ34_018310 [Dendrobium chrysotoxum]